jgi:ATP-dependent Lon protease
MVVTRSKEALNKSHVETNDIDTSISKISTMLTEKFIGTLRRPKKKGTTEENTDSQDDIEEIDDLESDIEEEYQIPIQIQNDEILQKKFNSLLEKLQKKTPLLQTILNLKCKIKDKVELFELYYIYKSCVYNSEERLEMKTTINEKIKTIRKETLFFKDSREKLTELNKQVESMDESLQIKKEIVELNADQHHKIILYKKYKDLENSEYRDEEYFKQKTWLQNALKLPFNNFVNIQTDNITKQLQDIRYFLDEELYGMENVKEQILLFLNNRFHNPVMRGCSLGLVGDPGVGKTSIALSLSKILSLPFVHIALGGLIHADSMKGHESTYVGSKPGSIAQSMMQMKSKNGILFFDELDKINGNEEIVNTMLHMTDFSQNHKFQDNYFNEIDIDLSSLWFIYSMNEKPDSKALADRIHYINVKGYNLDDKIQIIQKYILPKLLKNMKLKSEDICIDDSIARDIVQKVQSENDKGIRLLDKAVQEIISKTIFLVNNQNSLPVSFSLPEKYFPFSFPVTIDSKMLSLFLKEFEKEKTFQHLYI